MTNHKTNHQMIRFVLFSISAGIIQLIVFTVLFELLELPYWISYIVSLCALVLWNTAFNRKYTFKSTVRYRTAVMKLGLFYLFFIPLFTWGGNALTQANWNEYLVLAITMVLNLVLAFFYNKYYIYKT